MNRTLLLPFLLLALLLPAPAQAARDKELQPMADSLTNYLKEKTTVQSAVAVEKATILKDGPDCAMNTWNGWTPVEG